MRHPPASLTAHVFVRLSEPARDRLRQLAEDEGSDMSTVARRFIMRGIANAKRLTTTTTETPPR